MDEGTQPLQELIGRAPDPVADWQALTRISSASSPEFTELVSELRARPEFRESTLGALLPGLALLRSPRLADLLGVRAANSLAEAETITWRSLSGATPFSLLALPRVGPGTAEEVLSVAMREWASAYLREDDRVRPLASERQDRNSASTAAGLLPRDLVNAFADIEQMPGFGALRRRQLDPGPPLAPAEIASEQGRSRKQVIGSASMARRRLTEKMRECDWPLRVATEEIRTRLGSVAEAGELDGVFASIDPTGTALPAALHHRRALLLQLAELRVRGEWVLGPDIESLTRAVLSALIDDGSADLNSAARLLGRLGVREELVLRWIVSQRGFRIIDGRVVVQADD